MSKAVSKAKAARRRALLAAIGTTPVAAAILMTRGSGKEAAPAVPTPTQAEPHGAGYHETEHIRKYYRSMEF